MSTRYSTDIMTPDFEPYSYRNDAAVPPFDDAKPLIIFDGLCVLCSSGVQWMMECDSGGDDRFAAVQEAIPQALYRHYGLNPDTFDTFMVLKDGLPYVRWRGLCVAARLMPAPWRWLGALGLVVPIFIGDPIYDFIQRNRFGWFGARDGCFAPDDKTKSRFLREV